MFNIKLENDIILVIPKDILENLKRCVDDASPNEACGIIFGDIKQFKKKNVGENNFIYHYQISDFACIQSDKKSTISFLIENIEKLHQIIQEKIRELNLESNKRLISIFHSHPSGAHPSTTDLNQMEFLDRFSRTNHQFVSKAFKNLVWLIMDGSSYDLKGFLYLNDEYFQIKVEMND